jgi:Protein of unknown function (DUF1045)
VIGASQAEARVALYWAPELADPLHSRGAAWLGRDAETGAPIRQPEIADLDIAQITAAPRLYGLHATLKPPFRAKTSWQEVLMAAEALAASTAPFALPPLEVTELDGFLALRESAPCPALHRFAAACVERLDPHRRAPEQAEVARRRQGGLTQRQDDYLQRWGYPYVFEEWRFHVTLTRRLTAPERDAVLPFARAHLAAAAGIARVCNQLTLFTQAEAGTPFRIAERFSLRGA